MTTGQLTYQFCIDNYNSNKEFIKRNKSFLDVYQSKIGSLGNSTLTDEFFELCKTRQVICGDLIPPFLSPIVHEFELSNHTDVRDLMPKVRKLILDFDSSLYIDTDQERLRKKTLVIQFHQRNDKE
ncbi:MAG: hypothetical protein RL259_658 [Bacteroidota bacterium]|jgi:hypothetical protein